MQENSYVKVDEVEDADFWIPEYDKRFVDENDIDKRVTLGRPYKLFQSQYDDEIAIIDDHGNDITLWHYHRGHFVKKANT